MALEFTSFYLLKDLASPKVSGELCHSWNTQYARVRAGKRFTWTPEQNGSGYQLSDVSMRDALPPDVARICEKKGIIYILVSRKYNILYVGITRKQIAGGVFNGGRFVHHLRKIMASASTATSHPGLWQDHARVRYMDARALGIGDHRHFWSDLMISFAHDPGARQHEGTVLDNVKLDMRSYEKTPLILNSGAVNRGSCEVRLPANCPWREIAGSEEASASLSCVVEDGGS